MDRRDGIEAIERALSAALAYHVRRFFQRARQFIRESIVAGAMILGGPEPLDADDLAEAERQAVVQAQYLDRFEREAHYRTPEEIASEGAGIGEPMSAAQFAARAQQYGASIWGSAQAVGIGASIRGGATHLRRVHVGADIPCPECEEQQGFGWMAIGDPRFKVVGSCQCLQQCHCHVEMRWPDGKIRWAGGRPKRAA